MQITAENVWQDANSQVQHLSFQCSQIGSGSHFPSTSRLGTPSRLRCHLIDGFPPQSYQMPETFACRRLTASGFRDGGRSQ